MQYFILDQPHSLQILLIIDQHSSNSRLLNLYALYYTKSKTLNQSFLQKTCILVWMQVLIHLFYLTRRSAR